MCVKETCSQAAAATCGHVKKYASPVPRAWAVFAVFDVYFIANQLRWGKQKGSKITFFLLVGWELELGSWWVWEEEESPWGMSLGGLEKPNSPNCRCLQGGFFGTSASRAMGWQENSLISPRNFYLLAEGCLHHVVSTKLSFFTQNCFFFHQKSTSAGKSKASPHSLHQILGLVTFSHGFSHPFPARPTQSSKPLSPHCQ